MLDIGLNKGFKKLKNIDDSKKHLIPLKNFERSRWNINNKVLSFYNNFCHGMHLDVVMIMQL